MTGLEEFKSRFKTAAFPTVFACLLMYAGYHLIQGNHGILAYNDAKEQLALVTETYHRIHADRVALETRVNRLRPEAVDPDLLDERARVLLGRVHEHDLIIPLK